jgi:hypothetical protein
MSLKGKEILEKMRELRRLLEYMAGNLDWLQAS